MKIHQLTIPEALASLHTSEEGLSPAEAQRRLKEYGPNRVEEVRRRNRLLDFFKEFTRFFSIVLWIAAGLSFVAEWREPGQGMARIGYAIVVVILVSSLFSFWQEHRVEKALAALRRLLPSQVKVIRGGTVIQMPAE
ncbi:MAG: cation-transporting P-type ATPase, partial [Sulfuricella sp.]